MTTPNPIYLQSARVVLTAVKTGRFAAAAVLEATSHHTHALDNLVIELEAALKELES
jgi:hypothetical protein